MLDQTRKIDEEEYKRIQANLEEPWLSKDFRDLQESIDRFRDLKRDYRIAGSFDIIDEVKRNFERTNGHLEDLKDSLLEMLVSQFNIFHQTKLEKQEASKISESYKSERFCNNKEINYYDKNINQCLTPLLTPSPGNHWPYYNCNMIFLGRNIVI